MAPAACSPRHAGTQIPITSADDGAGGVHGRVPRSHQSCGLQAPTPLPTAAPPRVAPAGPPATMATCLHPGASGLPNQGTDRTLRPTGPMGRPEESLVNVVCRPLPPPATGGSPLRTTDSWHPWALESVTQPGPPRLSQRLAQTLCPPCSVPCGHLCACACACVYVCVRACACARVCACACACVYVCVRACERARVCA